MFEVLVTTVGLATAKAVLKSTLADAPVIAESAGAVSDLVGRAFPGYLQRRRAGGFFDRVADEVAGKLEPFFEIEFSGLPEGERHAAAHAVADTIARSTITPRVIVECDFQPLRLEAAMYAHRDDVLAGAYLSDGATQLYELTLRECSNYICELASALPQTQHEIGTELLRRDAELIQLVERVLKNLPTPSVTLSALGSNINRFEEQYRKEVARELDRLALFGLDRAEIAQRYALSVAYISLTTSAPAEDDAERPMSPTQGTHANLDAESEAYVKVDDVISSTRRILVRGEAGSGKTTLLQWLAVNAVRREFPDELEDLNDCIPFFLQLRRFGEGELPRLNQFIDQVALPMADEMPAGWVASTLESGRGLVLIDGVDELPDRHRAKAHQWVSQLCSSYPDARFLVTSRPPAASGDWLQSEGFTSTELQPMGSRDIAAFIDHWHAAAVNDADDEAEKDDIRTLGSRLQEVVRRDRSLRGLATSPLLCAVLCTLHRNRRAQLPRDRIELYRFTLEMLLDRRDVEREIADTLPRPLSLREKQSLVRHLAYWLVSNNYSEVSRSRAITLLDAQIARLPNIETPGEIVYRHLLIRSGLLREPVDGHVDFLHRSFQEYLAAEEALERSDIGVLISHALDDTWREVIIIAAGLARDTERGELIAGLLDRGDLDLENRHTLHLLAVACLEHSAGLAPELQERLQLALANLVPPKNMTEARSLASAGDLAVSLLPKHRTANVPIAKACIRTLSLIGSDEALEALSRFGHDRRVTVKRELVNAWASFDPVDYAKRVLQSSTFDGGVLVLSDPKKLDAVPYLNGLRELIYRSDTGTTPLHELRDLPVLTGLMIEGDHNIRDFDALAGHPNLNSVTTLSCSELVDVSGLNSSPLRDLQIYGSSNFSDLSSLDAPLLMRLGMFGDRLLDQLHLESFSGLRSLSIRRNQHLSLLDVGPLVGLEELNLNGCRQISEVDLEACESLALLDISGTGVSSFESLAIPSSVEELRSSSLPAITSLTGLPANSVVRRLHLIGCANLKSIDALASCTRLEYLDLEGCIGLTDIGPLAGLERLRWLDLSSTSVDDLRPLDECPSLRSVTLDADKVDLAQAVRQRHPGLSLSIRRAGRRPRLGRHPGR